LREELKKQGDELARARADYYNLTQTHNNFVRRSKSDVAAARGMGHGEVIEALMPVLDDIEAARNAGALEDGPFAAIANKLENTLETRFGFERFGASGDEFDPNLHNAISMVDSEELKSIGLTVPKVTMVAARLRAMGLDIPPDIYTTKQLKTVLCALKGGRINA